MTPIMDFDKEPEKLYYSIGEVADIFNVNTSLVRFWEKEFEILKPAKNKKGNRLFTPVDLENLKLIYHLVKERGYTLDGAKKKLRDNKSNLEQDIKIRESLLKIKSYLEDLKEQL